MKYITVIGTILAMAGCCARPVLDSYIPHYNASPASMVNLSGDTTVVSLTDFLPTFEGIDSVSSSSLTVIANSSDWSKFSVVGTAQPLNLLHIWQGGKHVSLVARNSTALNSDLFIYTAKSEDKLVVKYNAKPDQFMAMWQNAALPTEFIEQTEDGYKIKIPAEASKSKRSFLRVYAANSSGISNDILVPLESGRAVKHSSELTRTDRQTNIIYSLMVDRFNNGDKSNDWKLNSPEVLDIVDYQGGDLAGITDKIRSGFFTDLGINTIWLSPIMQNPYDAWGMNKNPKTKFTGYHGYWPVHLTAIDKRMGTDKQLRTLISEAHSRKINVIMDYVANHLHINSPILKEHPDWKTTLNLADGRKNLELWDEQRLTTWFDLHIPSLDLENPQVYEPMTDSALYWFKNFDFDGVRHDATKHIPEIFWQTLTRKIKTQMPERDIYQIGETYGNPQLISSYVKSGMLDAQFDFNVYDAAIGEIGRINGSLERLDQTLSESLNTYGYHNLMGYITGNHDRPRFISLAGGALSFEEDSKAAGWLRSIGVGDPYSYNKLGLLQAFIMTIPGIPCIYQGDEYGVPGGNDPDNRHNMNFDNYSQRQTQLRENLKKLTSLRSNSMSLLYGDLLSLYTNPNVMVFARIYMDEVVVVALNRSNAEQTVDIKMPINIDIKRLKPNFNNNTEVTSDQIKLTIKPLSFEILN